MRKSQNLDLDTLPKRESMRANYRREKNGGDWSWDHHNRKDYHCIDNARPTEIVERILNKNIGNTFKDTFSYFCRKYPKYYQQWFLNAFQNYNTESAYSYKYWEDFYIDDNDIICKDVKEINDYPVIFIPSKDSYNYSGRNYQYHDSFKKYDIKEPIKFNSRFDPEYLQLMRDDYKKRVVRQKREKKAQKLKQYDFTYNPSHKIIHYSDEYYQGYHIVWAETLTYINKNLRIALRDLKKLVLAPYKEKYLFNKTYSSFCQDGINKIDKYIFKKQSNH